MSIQPQRTQYVFDLSGVRSKSMGEIMRMRTQWDTFERVENYNDVIYQRLKLGNRDKMYYQFQDREEANDYKNGQQLHISRYPNLSPSTFNSISNKPMPNVVFSSPPPYVSHTIKPNGEFSEPISSSEQTGIVNDNTIYQHVSTYNSLHTYKYIFPSNEEQLAYHRAERLILLRQVAVPK